MRIIRCSMDRLMAWILGWKESNVSMPLLRTSWSTRTGMSDDLMNQWRKIYISRIPVRIHTMNPSLVLLLLCDIVVRVCSMCVSAFSLSTQWDRVEEGETEDESRKKGVTGWKCSYFSFFTIPFFPPPHASHLLNPVKHGREDTKWDLRGYQGKER